MSEKGELYASGRIYAGIFLVAFCTLMYEVLLTRIFSVTMWYHFAFVAISVAMFGMTVGALVVYLRPQLFVNEAIYRSLGLQSVLFAVSMVIALLLHIKFPVFFTGKISFVILCWMAVFYLSIALPFFFSGICICLILTRFSSSVSRLYAADLAGAGLGCVLLTVVLRVTDGPTAVFFVAGGACAASLVFLHESGSSSLKALAAGMFAVLTLFAVYNTILVSKQRSPLKFKWVKGLPADTPLYEKWNTFSRIVVSKDAFPLTSGVPFGWGMSSKLSYPANVDQMLLTIDSTAATPLTGFNGDLNSVEFLKYDITNLVHYLRSNSDVLVIGAGGGRDILSALYFKQKSILAVEINRNIINAVNRRFGDFTGHLDRYPNVRFVRDEARSFLARQTGRFDIIQISLIDTWAATAAGAFVLSENSLYTVEAWKLFVKRLSENGILSVSRWYNYDHPAEMYRLASLAAAALTNLGIAEPRRHIMIARTTAGNRGKGSWPQGDGVGTLLLSRSPFSGEDISKYSKVVRELEFTDIVNPQSSTDSSFFKILSDKREQFVDRYPFNIKAPTDDSPFFFNMLRFSHMDKSKLMSGSGALEPNIKAVSVLVKLLVTVLFLAGVCIFLPLFMSGSRIRGSGSRSLLLFFGCIGLGFMTIEIALMQRLNIFLGHPSYGLMVVLFTLLLGSGAGSYFSDRIKVEHLSNRAVALLSVQVLGVVFCGFFTAGTLQQFEAGETFLRIAIASIVLLPMGFLMGVSFPLGMKAADLKGLNRFTPWLWGVNGAAGVCASVLAVVISLFCGISASYWFGTVCYLVAFVAFLSTVKTACKR